MDVTPELRRQFDATCDEVVAALPEPIHKLLEEVFLTVLDEPTAGSRRGMRRSMNPDRLQGLYSGVPLIRRSVFDHGRLPDRIEIYRRGILNACRDAGGRIDPDLLADEIRRTILHEIGHHYGMGESDLRDLGY